jgi:hypothetical protein
MADTNQTPQNQNAGAKQGNSGLSWSQPQNQSSPQKPVSQKPATSVPPEDGSGGRIVAIIIAVIIIFAIGAWGIVALRNRGNSVADTDSTGSTASTTQMTGTQTASQTPTQTTPATETSPAVSTVSNSSSVFSVASQPAGTSVAITNMHLTQPTWIVVYESRNGKPGNVLGAGLFFNTDTSGTVPLMRGTVAGQTYFVTAATDTGSRIFSMQSEKPVLDQSGQQVWTTFSAQ